MGVGPKKLLVFLSSFLFLLSISNAWAKNNKWQQQTSKSGKSQAKRRVQLVHITHTTTYDDSFDAPTYILRATSVLPTIPPSRLARRAVFTQFILVSSFFFFFFPSVLLERTQPIPLSAV
jgi:hypothetical protein